MKAQTKTKLDHLISFFLSVVINGVLMVAMLYFITGGETQFTETVTVEVLDVDDVTPIEDIPDEIIEDPVEVDDALPDVEFAIFESDDLPDFTPETEVVDTQATDTNLNEMDQLMTDIASPIQMNIAPGRTALGRQAALDRYGQGLGGQTEPAVNRALAWLARVQKSDGSWDQQGNPSGRSGNAGYTGLALLTFLSAGKTPGDREYGQTVARAIRYLVEVQEDNGVIRGGGREVYAHPMATYALAEAYTMTENMMLREPLIRATRMIIEHQMEDGGFPGPGPGSYRYGGGGRNDSSVTGWHVQALKAVSIAAEQHGLEISGLEEALQKSMDGMLVHAQTHDYGLTIGYTSPGRRNIITAAGALGMHLTGRHRQRQTRQMLNFLDSVHNPPEWENNTIGNEYGGMINLYYYAVQAFFHNDPDGREYRNFFTGMARALTANQSEEGYWLCFHDRGRSQGRVFNTTLAALGLMVPYRYLPTTQAERIQTQPARPAADPSGDDDDLIQFEI